MKSFYTLLLTSLMFVAATPIASAEGTITDVKVFPSTQLKTFQQFSLIVYGTGNCLKRINWGDGRVIDLPSSGFPKIYKTSYKKPGEYKIWVGPFWAPSVDHPLPNKCKGSDSIKVYVKAGGILKKALRKRKFHLKSRTQLRAR